MAQLMDDYILQHGLWSEGQQPVEIDVVAWPTASPSCLHVLDAYLPWPQTGSRGEAFDHRGDMGSQPSPHPDIKRPQSHFVASFAQPLRQGDMNGSFHGYAGSKPRCFPYYQGDFPSTPWQGWT